MGEIAEMMLDGTLCEMCGCYIDDDDAGGYPRYCSKECAKDRGVDYEKPSNQNVSLISIADAEALSAEMVDALLEDEDGNDQFTMSEEMRQLSIAHMNVYYSKLYVNQDGEICHDGFDKVIAHNKNQPTNPKFKKKHNQQKGKTK